MVCGFCGEEIVRGELVARWATDPLHAECGLRLQIGSVAHLERRCPCYGGDGDDPPNMTKRQAARLACQLFVAMKARN